MAKRLCPACRKPVLKNISPSGECLSCGHDLLETAPPPAWQRSDTDLRKLARRQRSLIWFVLAIVVLNMIALTSLSASTSWIMNVPKVRLGTGGLLLIVQLAAIVNVMMMLSSMDVHVVTRVIYAVLMLVPLINILVLLSANSQATKMLKDAGLKVGILGVGDDQVLRVLSRNHCTACGYLLAGNVSGTCPECGAELDR
jgi:hypothetical protein